MIQLQDVSFWYDFHRKKPSGRFGIDHINVRIEDGYFTSLLGANGTGKTTLLKLMHGMLVPKSGKVLWNGNRLTADNLADFHRSTAYVGGEKWAVDALSVKENLALLNSLQPQIERTVFEEVLEYFELPSTVQEKVVGELSTGQQMQVQFALALAKKPEMMLLDEPLAHLDPVVKMDMLNLLHERVTREKMGVLLSTHLIEEIKDLTDYVIQFDENGQLQSDGHI